MSGNQGNSSGGKEDEAKLRKLVQVLVNVNVGSCDRALQMASELVQKFLFRDKAKVLRIWIRMRVRKLMDSKELLPFLDKCLGCFRFPLWESATWIVAAILKYGSVDNVRDLVASNIIPTLAQLPLSLLTSDHHALLLEQITIILGMVAKTDPCNGASEKLVQVSSKILNKLETLLSKSPSEEMLCKVSDIVVAITTKNGNLCQRYPSLANLGKEWESRRVGCSNVFIAREALPLIRQLVKSDVVKVCPELLSCLHAFEILKSEDIAPIIADKEFCAKLGSYLSSPDKMVVYDAGFALGFIADKGPTTLLNLLKTLKDTPDGLKDYWKLVQLDCSLEPFRDLYDGIQDLILNDSKESTATDAVLEAGIVPGLISLLQKDTCKDWRCQRFALSILLSLWSQLSSNSDPRMKQFSDLPILPHLVKLLKYKDRETRFTVQNATAMIAKQLDASPQRRNEAVSLGLLPNLLDIVAKRLDGNDVNEKLVVMTKWKQHAWRREMKTMSNVPTVLNAMMAVKRILGVEPELPMYSFEGVPLTLKLKEFLNLNTIVTERNMQCTGLALDCFAHLLGYGNEGIEMICNERGLIEIFLGMLYWSSSDIKLKVLAMILQIMEQGKPHHCRILLESNVISHFSCLLFASSAEVRKMSLELMLLFLNRILTPVQRKTILQLKPAVLNETKKKVPETFQIALNVYERMIA